MKFVNGTASDQLRRRRRRLRRRRPHRRGHRRPCRQVRRRPGEERPAGRHLGRLRRHALGRRQPPRPRSRHHRFQGSGRRVRPRRGPRPRTRRTAGRRPGLRRPDAPLRGRRNAACASSSWTTSRTTARTCPAPWRAAARSSPSCSTARRPSARSPRTSAPTAGAPFTMQEYENWGAFTKFPWDDLNQRQADGLVAKGQALVSMLLASLVRDGAALVTGARGHRLLTDGGRVTGVVLESGEVFHANDGVVLATGGFEWDKAAGRLDARLAALHHVLTALEHRRRPADGPADRRPDPRYPRSLVGPDVRHRRHPRRAADRHPAPLRAPGPGIPDGQPPRPPLRQRIPELQRPGPEPAVLGLRPEPDAQHPGARDRRPRLPGAVRHPGPPRRPAHARPT